VMRKSVLQEIKEGILYFMRNKSIRFAAWVIFVLWSALGAVYVVIIVFVQNTLHSATKDLGLVIMFLGVGLFLGSLVYGRFGQRVSHYKIIFTSLVLIGIMLGIFAIGLYYYPHFLIAAVLSSALGFLVAPVMIASNTIIHKVSESGMLGKVFSSLEIVMHLGFVLFMFVSSLLADIFSHLYILIIIGSLVSIFGIINLIWHRKIPWLD